MKTPLYIFPALQDPALPSEKHSAVLRPGRMVRLYLSRFPALFREGLFPGGCAICGKALRSGREAFFGLCSPCREHLRPEEGKRCSLCGRPLISETETCLPCRRLPPGKDGRPRYFDRMLTLFPYTGKYQKMLRAYKFGRRLSLGNFFASALTDALGCLFREISMPPLKTEPGFTELPGADCGKGPSGSPAWVPVPPRPGKIKQNGWDQIEYLARLLERPGPGVWKLPVSRCLRRFSSESQKTLDREERRRNIKGRIAVDLRAGLLGCRTVPETAVLFDDVYTTGSTMDACAEALKSGGAKKVYGICLVYD